MKHFLIAIVLAFAPAQLRAAGEWMPLFDGQTFTAWTTEDGQPGAAAGWLIEPGGVLHLPGKGRDLLTERDFASFELEWEWKLDPRGNNGVKYWVTKVGGRNCLGIEYQMVDDKLNPDGLEGGNKDTASLYDIVDSSKDKVLKPIGEWNLSRVVVQNGRIEHWLNGRLAATADTTTDEWRQQLAKSKFRGMKDFAPGHGKIMLTAHGYPAWYRNIRVREL